MRWFEKLWYFRRYRIREYITSGWIGIHRMDLVVYVSRRKPREGQDGLTAVEKMVDQLFESRLCDYMAWYLA